MARPEDALVDAAVRLAIALPADLLSRLSDGIAAWDGGDWAEMRVRTLELTPQTRFRALVDDLLTAWRTKVPTVAPLSVALTLRATAATACHYRTTQIADLAWTGPDVLDVPLRRTDQALLEVIALAEQELLIVSFAVYKIPEIAAALVRAFERGVRLRICVEAPEPEGERTAYDTIRALGKDVQQRAAIYIWPQVKRPTDVKGRTGILHVKCAVADTRALFLSSANLTAYAMETNMEMGVLIRGGDLPRTVVKQFARMMESGVLQRVTMR